TRTVNVRVALKGGEPLSVTRTVSWFVDGTWVGHENSPLLAPIVAPDGGELRANVNGLSGSLAVTVKLRVWPAVMFMSGIAVMTGGALEPSVFGPPGVGVPKNSIVGVPSG